MNNEWAEQWIWLCKRISLLSTTPRCLFGIFFTFSLSWFNLIYIDEWELYAQIYFHHQNIEMFFLCFAVLHSMAFVWRTRVASCHTSEWLINVTVRDRSQGFQVYLQPDSLYKVYYEKSCERHPNPEWDISISGIEAAVRHFMRTTWNYPILRTTEKIKIPKKYPEKVIADNWWLYVCGSICLEAFERYSMRC